MNATLQKEIADARRNSRALFERAEPLIAAPRAAFGLAYKGMQFGDYAIGRLFAALPHGPAKAALENGATVDFIMEKTFDIPQYYGGLRSDPAEIQRPWDRSAVGVLCARARGLVQGGLGGLASKLFGKSRVLHDYGVLRAVENRIVPRILTDLFDFKELGDVSMEALESLRKMRAGLVAGGLQKVRIGLADLRQTKIEKVHVKNLRKTVKCVFEFTAEIRGRGMQGDVREERHFGGAMEFIRDDGGRLVANSFSYERL